MQLIDGKATAAEIKQEIAEEVANIVSHGGKRPHLAAILVGHDGGSETYVKNKVLACEACGFTSTLIRFEDDVTESELLSQVDDPHRYNDEVIYPDKVKLNLYYLRHYSFWTDMQIIICTVLGKRMIYNGENI